MITDQTILQVIADILQEEGDKYLQELKTRLKGHGLANSRLYQSLSVNIDGSKLTIDMNEYAKWVEQGRGPGKQPPLDKIKDWISRTPGLPNNDKSLPFLIARKIGRQGIPPRPFLEPDPTGDIGTKIKEELGDYLVYELENN